MTSRAFSLLVAASTLAAACAHSTRTTSAESPAPPADVAAVPVSASVPDARACSADDQCGASELCVSARCVPITDQLAECGASAHFDFDRADLQPSDLPGLQRVARCMSALSEQRAQIAGNCDERGAEQYNIALGFRRAHAVATYLEDLGVPAPKLNEVSYGKERPVCTDVSEACWARNRRADVARADEKP